MSLFNKMFDTRTLVQVIGALCALLVMKARVPTSASTGWLPSLADKKSPTWRANSDLAAIEVAVL